MVQVVEGNTRESDPDQQVEGVEVVAASAAMASNLRPLADLKSQVRLPEGTAWVAATNAGVT